MQPSTQKSIFLAIAVIAAFYFMPVVGVLLVIMLIHWKFRDLMWRVQMAIYIFMAVFFVGLYLSNSMGGLISWLAR